MKRNILTTLLVTVLVTACSGRSLEPGIPPAGPVQDSSSKALSWWSRAAMDAYLRWQVHSGARSGFVIMFARDGIPVYANAIGYEDIHTVSPMTLDTRMRFASNTKPITAVAAMLLVEEGRLGLDDPIAQYLPALANLSVATSQVRGIEGEFPTVIANPQPTVRHLLMFASGIGPGMGESTALLEHWRSNGPRSYNEGTLRERIERLATLPLFEQPGTRWRYGWSADVLAAVIEVASGQPFNRFLKARVFDPLGMSNTSFLYERDLTKALATVYTQDKDGELVVSYPDSDANYPEGGSGLVSTAGDYMRFALMLWNQGEYQGTRILQPETVAQMTSLQVPDGVLSEAGIDGLGWGLGMAVVADEDASRVPDRTGDFWWSGYFGTTFFVSPSTGLVGVVLSQNEPSEFSGLPISVYLIQGMAYAGL